MSQQRNNKRNAMSKAASQTASDKRQKISASLSQPLPSTSSFDSSSQTMSQTEANSEEETYILSRAIRYILIMDKGKEVITKAKIVKNVLGNQGKQYQRILNKIKNTLSEVFGYRLVEIDNGKYIVVNEMQSDSLQIQGFGADGSRYTLLFIILTHIFMHGDSCTEESLWDFLRHLGILSSDNHLHPYFGNVKQLISEVFINQKYIDRIVLENNDTAKVEFKWGIRSEHEFSRRTAIEFVSQVYNGRPINSWPLQYKALIAQEKSKKH